MKYGSLRCLFTASQAELMELVRGPGPQLKTPTLLTCNSILVIIRVIHLHVQHSTHVAMLLLNKFEEGRHVRSAEVIDCLQAREHTALRDALEVILAYVLEGKRTVKTRSFPVGEQKLRPYSGVPAHQHRCPEVKFVEKLCDENVHLQHVGHIFPLYVTEDIDEPLKVPTQSSL